MMSKRLEFLERVFIFGEDFTLFHQPKCHGIKKRFSQSVKRVNFHFISIRFSLRRQVVCD